MKVYGDIESVNPHIGERFQRVSGDGESRLIRVGPADESLEQRVARLEKRADDTDSANMWLGPRRETDEERARRAQEAVDRIVKAFQEKEQKMPHYADGTPAKHGDLVLRKTAWDESEIVLIITSITANSDSCNAGAIPLAAKQGDAPWFPSGPQPVWTITLKECMRIDAPTFPAVQAAGTQ